MQHLRQFLQVLGYRLPAEVDRKALQKLLDAVRGKPESYAVNLAVLRSMQQAEYSPERIGHYALASEHYCHFTSPIRRYPDLTVHRLLERYLAGRLKSEADRRSVPSFNELESLGRHCSYTERRAEDAEQELKTVKILELLSERIGDVIDAVVTGVTNFGVFVGLEDGLEGLLHISELADHKVDNPEEIVKVGEEIEVKILRVDPEERKIGLSLKRARWAAEDGVPSEAPPEPVRRRGGLGSETGLLGAIEEKPYIPPTRSDEPAGDEQGPPRRSEEEPDPQAAEQIAMEALGQAPQSDQAGEQEKVEESAPDEPTSEQKSPPAPDGEGKAQ